MISIKQEDDGKKGRFVISENNEMAGEMTYTWVGKDKFIIDHTSVDDKFGGKGFAKILVQAGVDYARKNEVKIIPLCPYAKRRFDQDESIRDVLA